MTATFHVGDAIEVMSKLPEKSVDLILTSPPFLALRSYLPSDHPDKALEGGSQSTPGEYVDWLLDVVEACARVLAPHGSLCIELGDTYAGSGGAGGDYKAGGWREGQEGYKQNYKDRVHDGVSKVGIVNLDNYTPPGGKGWPLAKSLSLIPESFRFAMVYGTNPHTGRQTAPWRLRNVIRWVRPNPPVGALGDKFRPATSELMVFCKSAKRYFDLDAVREPAASTYSPKDLGPNSKAHVQIDGAATHGNATRWTGRVVASNPAGAPPLDWWNIPLSEEGSRVRGNPHPAPQDHIMADASNISLFDDEPTPYGPKPRDISKGIPNKALAHSPTKGNSWGPDETKVMYENPNGAPPLDWWNIPPGGSSQPRPVNPGEFAGGTLYIRSAGCPVHEDRSAPVATAPHGEPLETPSNRSSDTDGRPAQGPQAGSVPTVQPTLLNLEGGSSDSPDLPSTPAAKLRSKSSNRTAPAPDSTSPGTSSGRTRRHIDDIPNGPLSDGPHPDTPENRTSAAVYQVDPALESYVRTGHKPPELESCTCTFYTPESSHYAVFPEGVPLDWWEIPPGGFSGAHYAVWPPELCVKPVKAMCPEKVCRQCGEPSRRIVGETEYVRGGQTVDLSLGGKYQGRAETNRTALQQTGGNAPFRKVVTGHGQSVTAVRPTTGFSDCGHDDYRPGLVLDPFAGSGTTLAVATGHGRDAIGVDLDERNYDLALQRVGPFILSRG